MVREQSSWGDTDPFCCGQCRSLSEPETPPNSTILVNAKNQAGDQVSLPSSPQEKDENPPYRPVGELGQTEDTDSSCTAAPVTGETGGVEAIHSPEYHGLGNAKHLGGKHLRQTKATVMGGVAERPTCLPSAAVAAEFSKHLHDVDKYPLDWVRLCRFARFLTVNGLLREAYEVRGTGTQRRSGQIVQVIVCCRGYTRIEMNGMIPQLS